MLSPKIQVTINTEMLDELKKISSESGNSVSSIVRIAIAEYLKKRG